VAKRLQPFLIVTLLAWGLALGSILALPLTPGALAHPGDHGARYVAESGRNAGDCHALAHPCRTLEYALRQAQKGDEVRVAAGAYFLTPDMGQSLLSSLVSVRGGYTVADGFTIQDPGSNPTYLMGITYLHRAELSEQGFIVLQDEKGWPGGDSVPAASQAQHPTPAAASRCENGQAAGYPCHGVDFLSRISLDAFSSKPFDASDIWGFVDLNDNHEYALIGLRNGTAVVDVSAPGNPVEVGTILGQSAVWRDIKVYQFYDPPSAHWKAYAYVTADKVNQGLQIIDLTGLPESVSLAATYNGIASAHNIYLSHVDYATGVTLTGQTAYAIIAGANLDMGAFRILDLSNPLAPVEVTPPPLGAGYSHDVTTLLITDTRTSACAEGHNPCEVLVDFNESTVELWDITDKSAPFHLSSVAYSQSAYVHSGWWSKDKRFVFIQDESDERSFGLNTTLRTLDITNLAAPNLSHIWSGPTPAIDHNGFVKGDRYYMANYQRGLTILDIGNPNAPQEVAFFDTYPPANLANYNGAWGVYPFLPSGTILISDIEGGLILTRENPDGNGTWLPPDVTLNQRVYLPLIWK